MNRVMVGALVCLVVVAVACKRGEEPAPVAAPNVAPPAAVPGYGGVPPAVQPPAAAPAAPETVADLPDSPGATQVAMETKAEPKDGWARKVSVTFTSPDPFATVVAHFQKAIADRGWTVISSSSKPDEAEWKLSKGTSEAKVEIEQDAGQPVKIKLERKDR